MKTEQNATAQEAASPLQSLQAIEAPVLVREQAFNRLRDAIINGQLPPGTRLIERELCEAMGISRTSIREVLRRLEAEKLITAEPKKGPTVARLTKAQAREIYDIRVLLEALLVRRFVAEASEADITALERINERFASATRKLDVPRAVSVMVEFYQHMNAVVGTEVVNDILSHLTARVSYLRATSMSQAGRMAQSCAEIGAIVEAVRRRDTEAAEKAAVEHVESAAAIALARLTE